MSCVRHVAILFTCLAGPALAEPPPALRDAGWSASPAAEAAGPVTPPSVRLTPQEMQQISGGQEVLVQALTTQDLAASSSGNTVAAQTMVSGNVTFSADALEGFSGIGNFVVNTGSNNALQGAINVSVVAAPTP